ncbi:MAG: hypothetical protein ACRD2T_11835 [Thermoanaerobaculia bacterium]
MDAEEVIRRRFLSAFEQAIWAELPPGWADLRPERGKLRRSAAVLLQVAEQPHRKAMGGLLEEIAQGVGTAREGSRRREETRAREKPGEAALWRSIRELVDRAGETRPGEPNLFALELCRGQAWTGPLARLARDIGGRVPAATEEALTELARILLRATARKWSDEDRRSEKGAG